MAAVLGTDMSIVRTAGFSTVFGTGATPIPTANIEVVRARVVEPIVRPGPAEECVADVVGAESHGVDGGEVVLLPG